jgi:hypothetical protein
MLNILNMRVDMTVHPKTICNGLDWILRIVNLPKGIGIAIDFGSKSSYSGVQFLFGKV